MNALKVLGKYLYNTLKILVLKKIYNMDLLIQNVTYLDNLCGLETTSNQK